MLPGFISRCTIPFSRKCFIPAAETDKKSQTMKNKVLTIYKQNNSCPSSNNRFVVLNTRKYFKL